MTDRSYEAVVFAWVGTAVPDDRSPARALRTLVRALRTAGVDVVVVTSRPADAVTRRLADTAAGPGRLLVASSATGPAPLEPVLATLAEDGVTGDLVAVLTATGQPPRVGADRLPRLAPHRRVTVVDLDAVPARAPGVPADPPARLRRFLADQVERRRRLRVPAVDDDDAWVLRETSPDPARRRADEARFALCNGALGTRGAVEEADDGYVLADGVYTGSGAGEHLLPGPWWPALRTGPAAPPPDDGTDRRVLDLRSGLLHRRVVDADGRLRLTSVRFVSAARPGVLALRAETPRRDVRLAAPRPPPDVPTTTGTTGWHDWVRTTSPEGGGIAVATDDTTARHGGLTSLQRIAAYGTDARRAPAVPRVVATLDAATDTGFDRLLREHRAAWARRWRDVDVDVDDDERRLAVRFALFHLWGACADDAESALGARGLTGAGYSGHVFWDADVFVLPALVAMEPAAARAVLRYRLARVDQARAAARARGMRGARFPWESGRDGDDVTPRSGMLGGDVVPIRTGDLEEHVVADVAWAAHRYATWSGDRAWLRGPGLPLVVDAARYWADRCRFDDAGRAHVDGVIGPDEYHEDVDDNAYTNVMARWVLRRGADLLAGVDPGSDEPDRWRRTADALVDGFEPATGGYEQFRGFDALAAPPGPELGRRPVAADLLLGRERLAGLQVVKQPDVLMLHHLVPEEMAPGSLAADLDRYLPRTAHGSSLSPAVTAALLARAGRTDEALELLDIALRMDLDDYTGTTSRGLHVATMGGVWQALVGGFAGARVVDGTLELDPHLPGRWPRLGLRFRCLRRRVALSLTPDRVAVTADGPLRVRVGPVEGTVRGTWTAPSPGHDGAGGGVAAAGRGGGAS